PPAKRIVKPHGELITLVSDLFSDFPSTGGFISVQADVGLARILGAKPALSGLAVVGREDLRALGSFSLTPATSRASIFPPLSERTSVSILNPPDAVSPDLPLTSLQVESSEEGFLIIPGETFFKSRAVLPSSAVGDKDKDKDKDKGKDKDKEKDKDKCKDKGKDKDKCEVNLVNRAPVVNPGHDQTVTLASCAEVHGADSDDGVPAH